MNNKYIDKSDYTFITINDLDRYKLDERYLNYFKFSNLKYSNYTKRSEREFYHCSVIIDKVHFANSYAFGTGLSVSDGGAIFISSSQLTVTGDRNENSTFRDNAAGTGGAISLVDCSLFLDYVTFQDNAAYKFAGAISCESVVDILVDGSFVNRFKIKDTECFILNCIFNKNEAVELGGAVFIELLGTTYFERVSFHANRAGHSGGAVFASKTDASFYSCTFVDNISGKRRGINGVFTEQSIYKRMYISPISDNRYVHKGGLVRSGGAISFNVIDYGPKYKVSQDSAPSWNWHPSNRYELITNECCFNQNWAHNEHGSILNSHGHSVHLAGPVQYNSFDDYFDNNYFEDIVSVNNLVVENEEDTQEKQWKTGLFQLFNMRPYSIFYCGSSSSNKPSSYTNGRGDIYLKSTTNYRNNIPSPTEYTYCSTPLTRFPYATTRSNLYTMALTKKTFTLTTHTKTREPLRTLSATSPPPVPDRTKTPRPSASRSISVSASSTPLRTHTESPTASKSPLPTPSRSFAKYSRLTNVVTASMTVVQTDLWISGWSLTMSGDQTVIITGNFKPWPSKASSLSYIDMPTSFMEYSDMPFPTERHYTISLMETATIIKTHSLTASYSVVFTDGKSTVSVVPSYIFIETEATTYKEITFYINEETEENSYSMSAGMIIGLITGGVIIVFILAVITLYIIRSLNESSVDVISDYDDDFEDINDVLSTTNTNLNSILQQTNESSLLSTIMSISVDEKEDFIPVDDDWLQ